MSRTVRFSRGFSEFFLNAALAGAAFLMGYTQNFDFVVPVVLLLFVVSCHLDV